MKYIANVSTLEFYPERCTGCGVCTEVCPHGVFALEAATAYITDKDRCMECGACSLNCAFGAISVNTGVGCAAALINGYLSGTDACCGPIEESGEGTGKSGACC
ncbi:MAG: 4Fe-4S dicluster domain-containing protein [Phycisphaerae bacterium]|nr:4Fe-4S dicluster domain-containing protein [Phycisphaerae bacterium]